MRKLCNGIDYPLTNLHIARTYALRSQDNAYNTHAGRCGQYAALVSSTRNGGHAVYALRGVGGDVLLRAVRLLCCLLESGEGGAQLADRRVGDRLPYGLVDLLTHVRREVAHRGRGRGPSAPGTPSDLRSFKGPSVNYVTNGMGRVSAECNTALLKKGYFHLIISSHICDVTQEDKYTRMII